MRSLFLLLAIAGLQSAALSALTESPVPRAAAECGIGRQLADVELSPLVGAKSRLSVLCAQAPLTVIAMTSTSCPLSKKLAPVLASMEKAWKGKASFVFVDAVSTDTEESLTAMAAAQKWSGPCVLDATRTLASALGLTSTTEVLVLDKSRTVMYRGAVDDQYGIGYQLEQARQPFLEHALTALSGNSRPRIQATTAPGCLVEPVKVSPTTPSAITWHGRVSRIMQANCQECHHQGGLGPFPLETREQLISRAGTVGKAVKAGIMPPWFAAPAAAGGHSPWLNDRTLPEADRRDLLAWLAGDHAAGDPADAPVPRQWPTEWTMGTPDEVLTVAERIPVAATGKMPYVIRQVKTNFAEDRWVEAMEVLPSAREQTHHVLVFVVPEGQRGPGNDDDFFAAYVPGATGSNYPPGYAKRLPKGSSILFQLHYTPNGTAALDQTRLGLKFSSSPPQHEVRVAAVKNHRISIPPGVAKHEEKAMLPVPFAAQILTYMPHMHVRGKAFRYELVLPDQSRRTLLEVPAYDFNWQLQYRLAEPLSAPRGSRLEATAWYDNSSANPANPDPARTVKWGLQSDEEMLIGYVEYVTAEVAGKSASGETLSLTNRSLGRFATRYDTDGDGRVSRNEAGKAMAWLFERLDADKDGFVTSGEIRSRGRNAR